MLLERQWADAWHRLGLADSDTWRDRLLASYAEPARHYHTLQHLAECLALCDEFAHLAERPGEVAIALWFHDAVYQPPAKDNEARSAAWAGAALGEAGAARAVIDRVQALVMATARHDAPGEIDAALVIDIDLAILGANPHRFAQYEAQIRAEYGAVPPHLFQDKRRAVLAHFLARPALYTTPALRTRFEYQARKNLQGALGASLVTDANKLR
ncbi:HD domain-containing protein [Massilia sp. S19_KUP03_FR1]|uniref:HD domain-containing protein n=1 Tax=Massilia sp. S19_KUP03_FR1 TaxID=3025503 RepID=UPI002FCDDB82